MLLTTRGLFETITSHMGGIGYDTSFSVDFEDIIYPLPRVLFYTGENDIHKIPCQQARNILISNDFPHVNYYKQPLVRHKYEADNAEPYILKWLNIS